PTWSQKNSTVFNGRSARSSIRPSQRHCLRLPSACSVARKTVWSAARPASLRAALFAPFVSPTWEEMRLRTQEPRTPASRNSAARATRTATTAASPSGPLGPYAPFGTTLDGAASVAAPVAETRTLPLDSPLPTTVALTCSVSPGRPAVTYCTRQVRFRVSAIELYTPARSAVDEAL